MRVPMLLVALAACSSTFVLAGPPAPGADWFAAHRAALAAKLPPGAVVVLRGPAEPEAEIGDASRPDSSFWYLTGFPEADSIAVFRPSAAEGKRYVLFVRAKNWAEERWTGRRAGVEGAKADYRAEAAFPIEDFQKESRSLLAGAKALFYLDARDRPFREKLITSWQAFAAAGTESLPASDVAPVVAQMRLVKDATEIAILREAVNLSVEAHRAALALARPGVNEGVLKAAMVQRCLAGGGARMAYAPIVGSGPNSVILHYSDANRVMQRGEMIVNDTACEYGMYAADVTRSYPVSGRFSPEQRALYEIVLASQKAGIAKAVAGAKHHEIQVASYDVIVDGLLKLGLLKGTHEEVKSSRSYTAVFPHGVSHWLGLDVHDAGSYEFADPRDRFSRYFSSNATLRPGMVLTVEPGIYIPERSEGVDPKWWNIGVRIEDDILVTEKGPECLSCAAPRELADVENAMRPVAGQSR
ncbi:MAG: aminopeptidase P family protein [Thermoanaerobaculia bacterium]|nr:aminopeptidase P family protein [Thermoanaerobaculia bacterium]